MSNFWQRIITGIFLIVAIIGSLYLGFYWFSALFLGVTVLGLNEFYGMATPKERKWQYLPPVLAGSAMYIIIALTANHTIPYNYLELIIPIGAYFFLFELYKEDSQKPFESIGVVILGLIYVALPFALLNYLLYLPSDNYNTEIVMGCFIFLWCSDSGAYVVGRAIGKRKLFERISPKKTVEGSAGGILLAILVGYFLVSKYFTSISRIDWMVIAAIVSISGIYGDLLESMLKRSFGKKDSGRVLPGHGGVLDRFDSLILSAPLVYAYIQIVLA